MPKRTVSSVGQSLRSSLYAFLNRPGDLTASKPAAPELMEQLEPRVLLSAEPVMSHWFSINHRAGVSHDSYFYPVGMSADNIRNAYGIDQVTFGAIAGDGSGQTIAIVDAYDAPSIVADLHTFDVAMGLPDPPNFTVIGQSGTNVRPAVDPAGRGNSWAVEISLDVEWAHAVAPMANILLVEASSSSNSDTMAAVNTARNYAGVSVVSMSWGSGEWSGEKSYDTYFTTPAGHNGVTFVTSSGDSGAYDYNSTRTILASYPSSSPNVVSVGGTFLSVDASGNYVSESGWGNGANSGRYGGSGGGISKYEAQPAYQSGVVTQSTTFRTTPDVSMDADPASGVAVVDSWDFGAASPWVQVGGTSLASPLWAGVIAIADQGRVLAGQGTLDGKTETLPKLYTLASTDFNDITTGNNGYAAGAGYDLVTGRGTPIVNLLVADLAGSTLPVPTIGSFAASPTSGIAGTSVALTASNVRESSGAATISTVTFYRESNSTTGLQTGGDTRLGAGEQSGTTWTYTFDTTGLADNAYTFYAVATDSSNVASATASTTFKVVAPAPANDNFANATVLTGATVTVAGNNAKATKEAGEPNIAGNIGGKSVWYAWTATSSGKITLDTVGSTFDTLLGVYTGNTVSTLTAMASNDDQARNIHTSLLTMGVTSGTTYYFVVDGYNSRGTVASGNYVLNLSMIQAPANDNFANAAVLAGTSVQWTGANVGATRETGEPTIARAPGGASIWFTWVAPSSGKVTLNTTGSKFDTLLGVYTGTVVSSLTKVADNDDASRSVKTSAVTFTAVSGATYYFAVDGYRGATGTVVMNLALAVAPANDNFAKAAIVAGNSLTWTGTNVGAGLEAGEPRHAGVTGGVSLWLTWTAAASGTVTLDTHGSDFDTILAVYTGSSVGSLSSIAANDDDRAGHLLTSLLTFNATAGIAYFFAIDGYGGATGNITLNLS